MEFEDCGDHKTGSATPISLFLGVLEDFVQQQTNDIVKSPSSLEEIQYLHIRNALVQHFKRKLTPVEKSLVNSRLMDFVPVTLRVIQRFLVRNGALDLEGIFRIAPSGKVFSGALAQCEETNKRGVPPRFLLETLSNKISIAVQREQLLTTVASLYKMYLRRMEALISKQIFEDIMVFMPLIGRLRASFPKLLSKIPTRFLRCLRHILAFLREVSTHEERNRMSVNNLARVFAPSLLPMKTASAKEPAEPSMDFMLKLQQESDWHILCIETLINDQDDIFDEVEDIIAQKKEEEYLTSGSVSGDTFEYQDTLFHMQLRGSWFFPTSCELLSDCAAVGASRSKGLKKKKRQCGKPEQKGRATAKSLQQIGDDFRKVMLQIEVFKANADEQNQQSGNVQGGAPKLSQNTSNFCLEFVDWPLPFAVANVASDIEQNGSLMASSTTTAGMLCIAAIMPSNAKEHARPHWRLKENDGVVQIHDMDTMRKPATDVLGYITKLHKFYNAERIRVHFCRSYISKRHMFNGTCILEGNLCRKARKKIVKKNWKRRWFKLFAVENKYSVLVYYKNGTSDKVKGRYFIDNQCQVIHIKHPDRPFVFQIIHLEGSFSIRLDALSDINWALWTTAIEDRISHNSKKFDSH